MPLPVPGLHGAHRRADLVSAARSTPSPGRGAGRRSRPALDRRRRGDSAPPRSAHPRRRRTADGGPARRAVRCHRPPTCTAASASPHPTSTSSCRTAATCAAASGLVAHHGRFIPEDVQEIDGLHVLALDRVIADLLCLLPWRGRARDALAVLDQALRHGGSRARDVPQGRRPPGWSSGRTTAAPSGHAACSISGRSGPSHRRRAGCGSSSSSTASRCPRSTGPSPPRTGGSSPGSTSRGRGCASASSTTGGKPTPVGRPRMPPAPPSCAVTAGSSSGSAVGDQRSIGELLSALRAAFAKRGYTW